MGQNTLLRIDDPIDERKRDLAKALNDYSGVVLAYPAGRSNNVYAYYEESAVTPRGIFTKGREHGYVPTSESFESREEIQEKHYAFFGSRPGLEHERYNYVELNPVGVLEFTCDWCDEHKRGERSASRYKPEEQQTEGYPKDMWTLCRDCDPEYDSENDEWDHAAAEDHPRLGSV